MSQAVSREIVSFLRSSVTAAWRHGWQPAELARHAGRELGGVHASMAADMIADEVRGYDAATVDDRWAAQVASLDAGALRAPGRVWLVRQVQEPHGASVLGLTVVKASCYVT